MTDNNGNDTGKFEQLRKRAQAYLSEEPSKDAETMSHEEARKLVHELDTYRIELELQNADLRNAQEELSESRQRFSDLYDFAPVGYLTVSDRGLILEANLTIANMLGVARGDLLKKPLSAYIVKEDQDDFYRWRRTLLDTGKPQTGDLRMQRSDGSFFHAQLKSSVSSSLDGDSGQFRTVISDVTEIKRLEKELFQAHKMEAMGTLAGGVAHDFNNILTAILGYSEMIKAGLPNPDHLGNDIDEILTATNRAKELVKQILAFSQKSQGTQKVVLQPQTIVREVLRMLSSTLPATIQLREEIDPACGTILADPTEFHQIVLNLCINASQAIANGHGTITVQLSKKLIDEGQIGGELNVSPGFFVELKVRDTGCGIDDSIIDRIFEPYFTTKEVGEGSGIGLAVIYGIVKSYGGMIRVDSEVGKGSTFRVYFPSSVVEAEEVERGVENLPSGTERILILDDEEILVRCLKKFLEFIGYTVTAHTESREAFEDFSSRPHEFDLVVTDQVMPNMTGTELTRKILEIRPDMPIILFSGYTSLTSDEKMIELGIKRFLEKPLEMREVAKNIREVLDKQSSQGD